MKNMEWQLSPSLALIQTPVYTVGDHGKLDTRLVHRAVCLFTFKLLLVFIAPTHRGMARLS